MGSEDDFIIVFNAQLIAQAGDPVAAVRENGQTASQIYEAGEGKLTEHQGSVIFGLNYKLTEIDLLPYLGIVANNSKIKSDNLRYRAGVTDYNIEKIELNESNRFGIVLGLNVAVREQLSIYLESRFKNESAISAGISYKF